MPDFILGQVALALMSTMDVGFGVLAVGRDDWRAAAGWFTAATWFALLAILLAISSR
jgi:hypothetical protein